MAETFFDRIAKTKTAHTPDVLSCLANLSNDEVFTPPDVVNQMLDLLPQELFSDPNTTFLDPACKTGVFLREIAKRLLVGLENKIPNLQERIDHIFHKQLYGIAITELTSLLSRRSLYCSKYPNGEYSISHFDTAEGNIRFRRVNHVWVNGKCKFCGATETQWKREEGKETHAYEFIHTENPEKIFNMKFDVIISNPPYQLSDGGGTGSSAMPIYQHFVEQDKKLKPRYIVMITPSRWFAGGKGLEEFRNNMLNDNRVRIIHDFPNASDCFPGVEIKGGVCYFLWDRDNQGLCEVNTHENGSITSTMNRKLLEEGNDVFIRYNQAISIFKKVASKKETSFIEMVSVRRPYGLSSTFSDFSKNNSHEGIKIYGNKTYGYLDKKFILPQNTESVDKYKVFISFGYGAGEGFPHQIINKPFIGEKHSCCTETYLQIGKFDEIQIAEHVVSYMKTKFFRFLVMLKKNTQNGTRGVYQFVPMQDFSKPWTDEELYKKYNLSQEEIDFIESMIKPME